MAPIRGIWERIIRRPVSGARIVNAGGTASDPYIAPDGTVYYHDHPSFALGDSTCRIPAGAFLYPTDEYRPKCERHFHTWIMPFPAPDPLTWAKLRDMRADFARRPREADLNRWADDGGAIREE